MPDRSSHDLLRHYQRAALEAEKSKVFTTCEVGATVVLATTPIANVQSFDYSEAELRAVCQASLEALSDDELKRALNHAEVKSCAADEIFQALCNEAERRGLDVESL